MFLPEKLPLEQLVGIIQDELTGASTDLGKYIADLELPDIEKKMLGTLVANLVQMTAMFDANVRLYEAVKRKAARSKGK